MHVVTAPSINDSHSILPTLFVLYNAYTAPTSFLYSDKSRLSLPSPHPARIHDFLRAHTSLTNPTMRLLKSQIEQKTGSGFVTLLPEEPEDMVLSFAEHTWDSR